MAAECGLTSAAFYVCHCHDSQASFPGSWLRSPPALALNTSDVFRLLQGEVAQV